MRYFLLSAVCFSLSCSLCQDSPSALHQQPRPTERDFLLEVEPLCVLEGGPITLRVTQTYAGVNDLEVYLHPYIRPCGNGVFIRPPQDWEWKLQYQGQPLIAGAYSGPVDHRTTLRPGDQVVQIIGLHQGYRGIKSGSVSFEVGWNVLEPDGNTIIACLTQKVTLDVPPATEREVNLLRDRLLKHIEEHPEDQGLREHVVCSVEDTNHRGLVPVAVRLVELRKPSHSFDWDIEYAYQNAPEPAQVTAQFLPLALKPTHPASGDIFRCWRKNKVPLSAAAFSALTGSPSVWTRALTYVTFPRRCNQEWVRQLFQDLRDLGKALPDERVRTLLVNLDHEQFEVRQQAAQELELIGERVVPQLRRSLEQSLSVEARKRVEALLDKLDCPEPPAAVAALEHLRGLDTPEAGAILEVVAKGNPDSPVTKKARACLDERPRSVSPKP
jgi:hypothetical protein